MRDLFRGISPALPSKRVEKDRRILREYMAFSAHGLTLAIAVAIGAWVGLTLDEKLGTDPLLTFLGAGGGMAAGMYSLISALRRMERGHDRPDNID